MTAMRFAPDRAALAAALRALQPQAYAATRNHLDGAVTRLSPYLTHRMLDPAWLLRWLHRRHGVHAGHKLVQELGWRAYFEHVWRWRGDGILTSVHQGPLPDDAYAQSIPDDVLHACSGVPVVDQAVRALYRDGWLHNHARLWLASYLVHLRKVHWRVGADWMYGHLLDGDLASNHLSWQWVAGTASVKPYLFDAANVARFAAADWHSPGSVLDCSAAELAQIAHSRCDVGASGGGVATCAPPPLAPAPPVALGFSAPDPALLRGRRVWLVHPWNLRRAPADAVAVAVCDASWHAERPWSALRWSFVAGAMAGLAPLRWYAPAAVLDAALQQAARVETVDNLHLSALLRRYASAPRPAFDDPSPQVCRSYSAWAKRARPRLQPG